MEKINSLAIYKLAARKIKEDDAIMFDIDDTLIETSTGKPINDVIDILDVGRALGYTIVIITARPSFSENRKWTRGQLEKLDIYWDKLIYCPPEDKTVMKRELGYNFVLSIGDLETDLGGSEYWIHLSRLQTTTNMRI